MSKSKHRVRYLLKKYSSGNATFDEEQELFTWVAEGKDEPVKRHIEELVYLYSSADGVPEADWERLYQNILAERNRLTVMPVTHKPWLRRWIAAAAVLLLLGVGSYFYASNHGEQKDLAKSIELRKSDDTAAANTVNATLTLSNGEEVDLNSTSAGTVAMQDQVEIVKLDDGQIIYRGIGNKTEHNTLTNPRGSRVVKITLADGSNVWLNAASTLKYPTAFTGDERRVQITGEAYFEVAHNPLLPFTVTNGETTVLVLGTHFNVNAYDDETSLDVTVVEGRVKAIRGNQGVFISPGQQAKVPNHSSSFSNEIKVYGADLDEVVAWKNGLFSYKGADIQSIMRQLSRWYNLEVVFEKPVAEKFYVQVSRNTPVSNLLEMLEATNAVHFKMEGKVIKVSP